MARTPAFILLALGLTLALTGCVRRNLLITSDPPGALVYLNDQEVGRTPIDVPFTWYGTYDVRLEKDGYAPLWTQQSASAPWWDRPGIDLLAEAGRDRTIEIPWHFELAPAVSADDVDVDALLNHAGQMRELNQRD